MSVAFLFNREQPLLVACIVTATSLFPQELTHQPRNVSAAGFVLSVPLSRVTLHRKEEVLC